MKNRIHISSGTIWEDKLGYSPAVRIGNVIEVSGTTAINEETVVGKDNLYIQTKFILQKIEKVLSRGGSRTNSCHPNPHVCDNISKWEEAGKAHAEFSHTIKPATSMIEVSQPIDYKPLIEIEISAIVH